MNLKSGVTDQFEHYSQFANLAEFNRHMEMWLLEKKQKFTKGELIGLKRLIRFAAKFPGVANAKIGTILKAIHDEFRGNGISRSTFKRMLAKAKALGIITIYETERKNGSQSSNLYVFNRFITNEPPNTKKMVHHNKTINPLKTNHKDINKRPLDGSNPTNFNELDETYTNDRIPNEFVQLVKCFYPNAKTIEEFWRMSKIAAYRHVYENEPELILEYSILAFKQLVGKIKSRQRVHNPIAYYFGILKNKFYQLYLQELEDMIDPEQDLTRFLSADELFTVFPLNRITASISPFFAGPN